MSYLIGIYLQWARTSKETISESFKEHYDLVKKTCMEEDGVELVGLYTPMNKRWNWVYMFKVESIARLQDVTATIDKRYGGVPNQATNYVWDILSKIEL